MAQNQNLNSNTGYLIENEKKNPRQPDYRGKVTIDGKEWNLAVWGKGQRDGKNFFTLVASDPATSPTLNSTTQNNFNKNNQNNSASPSTSQSNNHSSDHQNQNHEPIVDDGFGSVFDGLP